MAKTKPQKNPDNRLPPGRFLAWRMRDWSLAASFLIVNGYLTIYCTDTLGMPIALVGTLLMVSKLIDGVGEMFAGYLVDNTKTKLGRGRPWELCTIGLWLSAIALFSIPAGASLVVKCIWLFVTYALTQSVFQTMLAACQTPYMIRAFKNKTVMVKLQSYGGVLGTFLSMIVSVSFPMLMKRIATSPAGWTKLMCMYGIPLMLIGLIRFIFVKEDVKVEGDDRTERIHFKEIVNVFKTNKYIWMVGGVTLLIQTLQGMSAFTYYFTYIVGDMDKYGGLQALTMVMLPLMFFFPMIIRKFSVSQLIGGSAILGVGGYIINFFAGANMGLLTAGFLLTGMANLAPAYLTGIMILDCATYSAWKGSPRVEGTISAINNLGTNVGSGLGSLLIGLILGAAGYVGKAAVQTPAALFMIRCTYSLIPAVLYVFIFILMRRFNKLEKQIPQIEAELKARSEVASAE